MRRPSRRGAVSLGGVVVAALSLSGCADDGNDAAPPTPPTAESETTATGPSGGSPTTGPAEPPAPTMTGVAGARTGVVVPVIALDNSFRPQVVEVSVGDEVRWENRGLNEHDVLHVDGDEWGIEVDGFQPGDVYTHVFTEPGEYRYYCSIHGSTEVGMVGTVVVTG